MGRHVEIVVSQLI